jgi:hypothetical protein
MRQLMLAASVLVFTIGIPLNILTEHTDTYFAWTIKSFLTAAFLGAAYWSSGVLELLAAREHVWVRARTSIPGVLVFTTLTLIATLLHLDKFHLNSSNPLTLIGTWVWLIVYAVVPPLLMVILVRQLRAPGEDPPRQRALPMWVRLLLGVDAAGMLVFGLALFFIPTVAAPLWPWALTELTGRAIGAWLIGLGIGGALSVWENDLGRVRAMMGTAVLFSLLQFVALARYAGEFAWGSISGWLYLIFLANFLSIGLYSWLAARQSHVEIPAVAA